MSVIKVYIKKTHIKAYIMGGLTVGSQGGGDDQTAAEVSYDNTASGLTSTTVQGAIDETASAMTAKADLVAGVVPNSQLPALALTDVFVVASQAAQLALSAQEGDVAVRTDENKSYIHNGGTAGTMADWQELLTPTDSVTSVFGRTGVVGAQSGDYTASQITNTPSGDIVSTNVQDAINELGSEKANASKLDYYDSITSDSTAAANTTEQTLGAFTIPAGTTTEKSEILVTASFDMTGSANTKTLRIKIDGNVFKTFQVTNTSPGCTIVGLVVNKGSLSSQIIGSDPTITNANYMGAAGATTSLAVDTANSFSVTITGQKSSAGETLTLKWASIRISRL